MGLLVETDKTDWEKKINCETELQEMDIIGGKLEHRLNNN